MPSWEHLHIPTNPSSAARYETRNGPRILYRYVDISPWIKTVQNILYESGLSNVWHFPNAVNHKWLNNCLKIRLHDEYSQTWSANVFHDDKCITYRIFKEVFEFESYLTLLPERLRILFTQFRLGNTKLPIETGRWFNIDRNERYCTLCNINDIGDEFHLLFVAL